MMQMNLVNPLRLNLMCCVWYKMKTKVKGYLTTIWSNWCFYIIEFLSLVQNYIWKLVLILDVLLMMSHCQSLNFFFFVIQKIQTNTLASPSHQPCHEIFSHLCWLNWYTNETLPYRLQNRFSHLWLSLGGSVNKCTKVPVWNRLCQTQTRSQFLWLENMQNPYCDFTNDIWMPSPIIHCCPISYNKKSITYRMNIAFHWWTPETTINISGNCWLML